MIFKLLSTFTFCLLLISVSVFGFFLDEAISCTFNQPIICEKGHEYILNDGEIFSGISKGYFFYDDQFPLKFNSTLTFFNEQGSVAFLFKAKSESKKHVFFHVQSPTNDANFRFRIFDVSGNGKRKDSLELEVFTSKGDVEVFYPDIWKYINKSDWNFFAVTWNKSTGLKLYVNGLLVANKTTSLHLGKKGTEVFIGHDIYGNSLGGYLENLVFFNESLTSVEIVELKERLLEKYDLFFNIEAPFIINRNDYIKITYHSTGKTYLLLKGSKVVTTPYLN